jgi:DNA-directed RNA polymerase specialized sigma subunit
MKFGYRDSYDRNETQVGDFHDNISNRRLWQEHRIPYNQYEAMMTTIPGQTEQMSEEEREQDWTIFQQKIESANLTERETIVVNCIVYGGMSLSQAATVVAQAEGSNKPPAKMVISRCRDKAFRKLRNVFTQPDEE